jgi:hypothetical protein
MTRISPVMVSRVVLSLARSMAEDRILLWDLDHFTVDSVDSDLSLSPKLIRKHLGPSRGEAWVEEELQRRRNSLI